MLLFFMALQGDVPDVESNCNGAIRSSSTMDKNTLLRASLRQKISCVYVYGAAVSSRPQECTPARLGKLCTWATSTNDR